MFIGRVFYFNANAFYLTGHKYDVLKTLYMLDVEKEETIRCTYGLLWLKVFADVNILLFFWNFYLLESTFTSLT